MKDQGKSIIQSTLFGLTLSIFITAMILILLFGQTFWEKESVKLENDLLKAIIHLKESLESVISDLSQETATGLASRRNSYGKYIQPLLPENDPYSLAYYDLELDYLFSEGEVMETEFIHEVLAKLRGQQGVTVLDFPLMKLVSVPVTREGELQGYVWGYTTKPEYSLNSQSGFYLVFSFMFLAMGIIVFLIRKYMKGIQQQLEEFSDFIVQPMANQVWGFHELPELKPAFDKIIDYTQELNTINEKLEASQRRINQIMEGISDGIFAIDREWRIILINDEAKKYFDCSGEDLLMKNILEVVSEFSKTMTYHKINEALHKAEPIFLEEQGMFGADSFFRVSIYPFDGGVTVFFRNVTEQRQHEREMAKLERLNLVGQMAAGISHEIRNPLTTVKGFLQLWGSKISDPQEKEYNDLMISEIDRANNIITEFLSLARDNVGQVKEQDINQVIWRIFPMIQADATNDNKEIILDLNPLPALWLNENEIRQLILNFVRNALEVTPSGGYVTISTFEDGNNVVLAVQDQGKGIPEEIRDKIGTPFFTTKESGTGLGIAISMGIAHRHNGKLLFDSGEKGTTFKVLFNKPANAKVR